MADDKPTLPSFPYETLPDTRSVPLPTFGELVESTGAPPSRPERYDEPQAPAVAIESPTTTLSNDQPSAGPDARQSPRSATLVKVPSGEAEGATAQPTPIATEPNTEDIALPPVIVTLEHHFPRLTSYDKNAQAVVHSICSRFARISCSFDCSPADADDRLNKILLDWIREWVDQKAGEMIKEADDVLAAAEQKDLMEEDRIRASADDESAEDGEASAQGKSSCEGSNRMPWDNDSGPMDEATEGIQLLRI